MGNREIIRIQAYIDGSDNDTHQNIICTVQQAVRDLIQEDGRYIRKNPLLLLGSYFRLFRYERITLVSYIGYDQIVGNNAADFKKKIDKIILEKADGNNLKNYLDNIDIDINAVDRILPLICFDNRRFINKEVGNRALRDKENIVEVEMRNIMTAAAIT